MNHRVELEQLLLNLKKMRRQLDKWIKETDDKIPENPKKDDFDRFSGKRLKK